MKDAVIVMTACIQPNTVLVSAVNVDERLVEYKKCIRFYLDQTDLPIYFLENTEYDLDSDLDFAEFQNSGRFTVLRFSPHPDTQKGKGFQEFYNLDRFVKDHLEARFLIKVTGRYIVKNVADLIANIKAPVNIDLHKKMKVGITGFFAMEKAIYLEHFYGKYKDCDDLAGRFIEHVVYDEIMNTDLKSKTELLPFNTQYRGVSGSYGGSLERNKYKMMVRGVERKLNRSMGIPQFLIEY